MSTIITSGLAGSSILAAGYGAIGIIATSASRLFKIFSHHVMNIYDKTFKIHDDKMGNI